MDDTTSEGKDTRSPAVKLIDEYIEMLHFDLSTIDGVRPLTQRQLLTNVLDEMETMRAQVIVDEESHALKDNSMGNLTDDDKEWLSAKLDENARKSDGGDGGCLVIILLVLILLAL